MGLDAFIEKAREKHGDKYDYSKVEYINNKINVTITCPIHGDFPQTPDRHLRGSGCKDCAIEERKRKYLENINNDEYIKRAKEIHGDKYDYSKFKFTGYKKNVVITCPKHGDFELTYDKHISGQGCKKCYYEKEVKHNSISVDEFIKRAKEVHGDKYDYSKVKFRHYSTDIIIVICPIHGEFETTAIAHINSKYGNCKKCYREERKKNDSISTEEFIKKAREKHGDKYDYSKTDTLNRDENGKVIVTCPIHGDFKVEVFKHIYRGDGCRKCGYDKSSITQKFTTEEFIKRAKEVHGDKYDYSKVDYVSYDSDVIITCPIHGDFPQTPDSHLQGSGCQKCSFKISKSETELCDILKENIDISVRNRKILNGKEIDIFIPSKNIGIEYNGLRWHSEKFGKDEKYHLDKLNKCNEQGIKLLQIFEDEYINHKEIVLNKIYHILGINLDLPKIMGRKCFVTEIDKCTAEIFLNQYHIQGFASSTVYLGCFYESNLVGVMTFKKECKDGYWELNRFASDYNYICQGVGGKLFKYFIKKYNPIEVKSFADRRWTIDKDNNLYTKLGFTLDKILKPDYKYYNPKNNDLIRQHKFNFRKETLHKKYGFDMSMTETEMVQKLGLYKIWDCGLFKYVWKNKL